MLPLDPTLTRPETGSRTVPTNLILSFDVEEHHRIEAAQGLSIPSGLQAEYAQRMEATTDAILERLAHHKTLATFYIVGEIALSHPRLVRRIAEAGHEIGSHSHRHERIHRMTAASLREDLTQSREALQQASGQPVRGFRAPTFSVVRSTAWAVEVLLEVGFEYDSSVFPVRHDRYGVPEAPRQPFYLESPSGGLLELPPATLRVARQSLPVAGGGYFRLFPLAFMQAGIDQLTRQGSPAVMLYFHPWEFDPQQPRLPLKRLSRFRTYVGVSQTMTRLEQLLTRYRGRFVPAEQTLPAARTAAQHAPRLNLAASAGQPARAHPV